MNETTRWILVILLGSLGAAGLVNDARDYMQGNQKACATVSIVRPPC